MKLLLDTHCLLWLVEDSPKLTAEMWDVINRAEAVAVSHASLWELGLKWRKGKIAAQPRRIADQARRNGLHLLPISLPSILESVELQHDHADPFDRLLYAQARIEGMRLMTIDRTLAGFGATILDPR